MDEFGQIAIWYCNSLPAGVRNRIFEDTEFRREIGMQDKVLTLRDGSVLWLDDAIEAAQKCYKTKAEEALRDLKGRGFRTRLFGNSVGLVREDGEHEEKIIYKPFHLALLSPDREERIRQFAELYEQFGVTGPRRSQWLPILENRPLSESEVSEIHDSVMTSAPNWWSITHDRILRREVTANAFVPPVVGYFENLCGPLPKKLKVEEYISEPLTQFRRSMVREDLIDGVAISLLGNLRADLSIDAFLDDFDRGDILESIRLLSDLPDPFSILGLIEISLMLGNDADEFSSVAVDLTKKLLNESLVAKNGLDVYELFPVLVEVSLRRLRRMEGLEYQPVYWYWYCSFVHAGYLVRSLEQLEFDLNEMRAWMGDNRSVGDGLADIVALHSEPTWRFDHLTSDRIRAEVVGRLKGIEERVIQAGRCFPCKDLVANGIESLLSRGRSPFRSGPLEGNLRPRHNVEGKRVPEKELDVFWKFLKETPLQFPWAAFDELSGTMYFPERFRKDVADALPTMELPGESFVDRSNSLVAAGFVAIVHNDVHLAERIADRIFREWEDEYNVEIAFIPLLVASMAVEGDEWVKWFEERLCRLAMLLATAEQRRILVHLLYELKVFLSMDCWKFSRVEALCRM